MRRGEGPYGVDDDRGEDGAGDGLAILRGGVVDAPDELLVAALVQAGDDAEDDDGKDGQDGADKRRGRLATRKLAPLPRRTRIPCQTGG